MSDAAGGVVERRSGLAPFVGRRVSCRAAVMRGSVSYFDNRVRATTLLGFVEVRVSGSSRAGHHVWLIGRDFTRGGFAAPGDLIEFTAGVESYRATDPASGKPVTRYGLHDPDDARRVGPMLLSEAVREIVRVWGWDDVADAVAAAQPGGVS